MAYQIIFFDLDGTLIDPKDGITKSVKHALSKFGINAKIEELIPFIGPPLSISFKKYYNLDDEQIPQAITYYREHFLENGANEVEMYEGARELLKKLNSANKTLCVVSSKFQIAAEKIIKEKNLSSYFEHIVATNIDESNAHKSLLIKEALDLYPQKSKQSFVMIGDREHDIFGAQVNGIDSIGVLYGYGSKEEIKKSKPTLIAKTLEELGQLLLHNQL